MHSEGSQRKRRIKTPGRTVFSRSMRPMVHTTTSNNSKISLPRSAFISRELLYGAFLPKPRSQLRRAHLAKRPAPGRGGAGQHARERLLGARLLGRAQGQELQAQQEHQHAQGHDAQGDAELERRRPVDHAAVDAGEAGIPRRVLHGG